MLVSLNCQSIKNKVYDVMSYLEEKKTDLACLQETWLKLEDKSTYEIIREHGYKIIKLERTEKRGGGLAILHKPNLRLKSNCVTNHKYKTFEYITCNLTWKTKAITVVNLYRPPYSPKHQYTVKMFIDEFKLFLSNLLEIKGGFLITGDFNINVKNQTDTYVKSFMKLLKTNNLVQLIECRTHVKGGTLDLVISDTVLPAEEIETNVDETFHSDHFAINIQISRENTSTNNKILHKKVRELYNLDSEKFSDDLRQEPMINYDVYSKLSVNGAIELYDTTLKRLLDKHCPLRTKKYNLVHARSRWYNPTLHELKRKRRKEERNFSKYPNSENKSKLKKARNRYNAELKQARNNFYHDKVSDCTGEPKRLFKTLNKLMGNLSETIIPTKDNEKMTANKMSKFYAEKILNIRRQINPKNVAQLPQQINGPAHSEFKIFNPISLNELEKIICTMNNKTCRLDPIPTSLVKDNIKLLLPILHYIVNASLQENSFPDQLKKALITPIIKDKSKNSEDFQNYRPVSNLKFLSKLLEKAIYDQLNQYIVERQMYSKHQSAYRKDHSCETALIKIMGDIQEMTTQKSYVALVLLDMSAAFDTVDHSLLLFRLENHFGIKNDALQLIKSYLENRTFSVIINEEVGDPELLRYGVPQGSVLGPLFYLLYTTEMENIVKSYGLNAHLYADDCQIYFSFQPENQKSMEKILEECLRSLQTWMNDSFLKFNSSKTLIKVFTPPNYPKSIPFTVNYDNASIKPVPSVKVLGITLGESRHIFEEFIAKKVQICNLHLRNLRTIRHCLPQNTKLILINNLIISQLDYCSSLLICLPQCSTKPLQKVLNKSIKFVLNLRWRESVSPFSFKLHILPVIHRIRFKICLIAHKIVYGIAPQYLQDKFEMFEPTTKINLRPGYGRDALMFKSSIKTTKDNTVYTRIIQEWYHLPLSLREVKSVVTFKTRLKTYLFEKAFTEFL